MNTEVENISYTQTRVFKPDLQALKNNRVITGFQPGTWVESFKMLRTRTLQAMESNKWSTLAVTSPGSQAGNSLTCLNLAISIAMELDRTVLLVDANFNSPSMHKLLDIEVEQGLGDYLLHDKPLSDLLINPGIDRMVVLPAGEPVLNSTEILRSPKMVDLVEELKTRYPSRVIIFDMPPLLAQADTLSFSPYVDSVLLVIDEGHTKKEDLNHAATLLKDVNLLGTVYNRNLDSKLKYTD